MSTSGDLQGVELSEVRDMTRSGEHLVIRSVTGAELIGRRIWCSWKRDVAWLARGADGVDDDARLDLALELTFPASDPVAVSSWEGDTASGVPGSVP